MRSLFAVLMLLIGMILPFAATYGREDRSKILIMATEATFPPYEFRSNGQIVGIDIDIAREVAAKLHKKLEVADGKIDFIIGSVVQKKADFAAAGLTITPERQGKLLFTIPYDTAAQMVLVSVDSPIKSVADLKGVRIACQTGTTAYDYVHNHIITDIKSPLLFVFDNYGLAVESLKKHKVDAVILDEEPARQILVRNSNFVRLLPEPLTKEEYAIAVHPDNQELCNTFNDVISELISSGKMKEIKRKNQYLAGHLCKDTFIPVDVTVPSASEKKNTNWVVSLWQDFSESFKTNFIVDNRWEYLWGGFIKTIEISFFAVLLGLLLGFVVAVIRSIHDRLCKFKILNALCRFYLTVIRGTPCVVQLLIIYFVVLPSCDNKVLVAIIAFGVNSGAYVAEIIRGGIMSIDRGQFEAGHSLGLSYGETMLFIILPQAFKNVLPALGNEFIV